MRQLQVGYQRVRARSLDGDGRLAGSRWALAAAVMAFTACAFDDTREHCASRSDCASDQVCYQGFCVADDDKDSRDGGTEGSRSDAVSSTSGSGGRGSQSSGGTLGTKPSGNTAAGKNGGSGGMSASGNGTMSSPSSGGMSAPPVAPAAGSGGMSGGGTGATPPAAGSGGTPPAGECRNGEERACSLRLPNASEGCNRGYQRCAGARWGECTAQPEPAAESCNGMDDDCDGMVDDDISVDCYPNGQSGCTSDAGGHFTCAGTCTLGKRTCTQGQLGDCLGARLPAAAETCTAVGMAAADENCNDMVDETCACTSGETRSCYTGPEGTLNIGRCAAGMQTCTNGALGTCMNSIVPVNETCNNVDDDCNGKVDDKVDTQSDVMNCGACGKECASGEGCCGGKCVKTATDMNNCGTCGTKCSGGSKCEAGMCRADMPPPMPGTCMPACAANQTCCGGTCVDTKTDAKNCGMCGMACSAGTQPGCCDGKCIDLVSNTNCGQCGKDCSLLGNGSITCTCTRDGSNKIACTGPVLNLCL